MVVREKKIIEQGAVSELPVVPAVKRRRQFAADTLPRQSYGEVIGVTGSSVNGAKQTAAMQALLHLDREVKRQRAAASPEIDLSPGSIAMTTMENIARGAGLDLELLKNDLRDVFRVRALANIGNLGPARTSKSSNAIDGAVAVAVARDIGHDFPDVIRATAKKLASLQGQEEPGRIPGSKIETTPAFVKTVWAYHSLYPSSRFIEEEITIDPSIQKRSGQKTLRETVNAALLWTMEEAALPRSLSPRFLAAAYDAMVYGADLLRQAPGPEGPMSQKSLAAAQTLEERAEEIRAQFLESFDTNAIPVADLGVLLDSRLLVGADAERGALIEKAKGREIGPIAEEMLLVHGFIRHGEIALAKEAAAGILEKAAGDRSKSATSVSAAWASLSWLAHEALTNGTFVEIAAKEKPARPIRVLIGAGDLELSEQRRTIGLGVA